MARVILPFAAAAPVGESPADESIYTYEGWRAYVNRPAPVAPVRLTRTQYGDLPEDGRLAYDEARKTYVMRFGPLGTPMVGMVRRCVRDVLEANMRAPRDQVKMGVIIDGQATLGKTTVAKVVSRQFELSIRSRATFPDDESRHAFIPVVHVTLQRDTTPKAMALSICHYLHVPLRGRETEHALVQAIYEAVERHNILLFVIDDIHFLRVRSQSGQETSNFLKSLMSLTGATFIYVGIDVEHMGILQEYGATLASSQTASRFIHLPIPAFGHGSASWLAMLRTVEGHLTLLDQQPGDLEKCAALICRRTGGSVGPLMNLLRRTALQAIGGQERIDAGALRGALMDYRSTMEGSVEGGEGVGPEGSGGDG